LCLLLYYYRYLYCLYDHFYCYCIGTTGFDGQFNQLGTGSYPGSVGHGSAAAPCGGGGGGFYSSGSPDTLYLFPGGQGFQQGGAGANPPSIYVASYQRGGFGGGGTANVVGSCKTYSGDRLTDILSIYIYIYIYIYVYVYIYIYLIYAQMVI
jgi:hypothetical protein